MSSNSSLSGDGASQPDSPLGALVVLPHSDAEADFEQPAWRTILSDSHQVVLYNSDSHALSVRPHSAVPATLGICPYCNRPLDVAVDAPTYRDIQHDEHTRASNYFQLLETVNEMSSRPPSIGRSRLGSGGNPRGSEIHSTGQTFRADAMAEGYFHTFFKEEHRLGMGANGSVFLCQHVLDGNPLGHFAVKKIAVGQSHSYLVQILREVRLLERLRHPNIVTYHHSWLETYQFSSFGPKVPTLFVLMQWAEGGSLDDFIESRLGRSHSNSHSDPPSDLSGIEHIHSRSGRIRAFRAARAQPAEERERRKAEGARGIRTAVHLLSAEEAKRLFSDVVSGLAFLHDKSILHLDLKPGNVLLTWDEDALIPRAMLSDFGTSRDMIQPSRSRSGNTGTLEYTAPESLPSPQSGLLSQVDSKSDMWSLGMILHMLLFFRLPYHYSSDGDKRGNDGGDMARLEKEILHYQGFKRNVTLASVFESRGLPTAYIFLLESLLNRLPKKRPSSEQVLRAIREGNIDPLPMRADTGIGDGTLVTRMPSSAAYVDAPDVDSGIDARLDEAKLEEEHEPDGADDLGLDLNLPLLLDGKEDMEDVPTPRPMLTLRPSPTPPLPEMRVHHLMRPLFFLLTDTCRGRVLTRPILIRSVKSAVLVLKVLSLLSTCSEGRPELIFTCFVLGLAVGDVWSESVWLTVVLAFLHVAVLHIHCPNSTCCV